MTSFVNICLFRGATTIRYIVTLTVFGLQHYKYVPQLDYSAETLGQRNRSKQKTDHIEMIRSSFVGLGINKNTTHHVTTHHL